MPDKPLSRNTNIVVQDLESEVLIYDLNINQAFCLNATAGLVYQLCDGKKTVAEIRYEMSERLRTLVSEDLVWLALEKLKKDNLLENADELTDHFSGMSRREVIKRVGLTSMAALPLISSVVAPTALAAQSGSTDTCVLPKCVAAGLDWCDGCIGRRVRAEVFFSTDGTCSDRGVIPTYYIPWDCPGIEIAPDNDLLIHSNP